jgi:pheromone a factor receptor
MHSSQSGLTADHYLRLIALSITEMVYMTAMSVFILYVNIQEYGLLPWVNWEYVHAEWLNIYQYPRVLVPQDSWNDTLAVWYIIPLTSIIFFAFFGIGREANEEYGKHFRWIQTHVFRVKPKATPVLPVS